MSANTRKQKMIIRFHDPNTPEESARVIAEVCVEAGQRKLERALAEAVKVSVPGKQASVTRPSFDNSDACS